jgi:hypothetical protein
MKKRVFKKISLMKETLRSLDDRTVREIAAGVISGGGATCNISCVTELNSCGPTYRMSCAQTCDC